MIGERKAEAYCKRHKFTFKLSASTTCFKFGNESYPSLISMKVRIPTDKGSFFSIILDIVSADDPSLMRLDVLYREGLAADNVTNESRLPLPGSSMPLKIK